MISLPVFFQVGAELLWGWFLFWGESTQGGRATPGGYVVLLQGCAAAAQLTCALLLKEVAVAPLDEFRSHKALVKLRSRQERELRELCKKHQRKAVALTRRLLSSLGQAQAESRCRHQPGVL